jgi:hypothetical protein
MEVREGQDLAFVGDQIAEIIWQSTDAVVYINTRDHLRFSSSLGTGLGDTPHGEIVARIGAMDAESAPYLKREHLLAYKRVLGQAVVAILQRGTDPDSLPVAEACVERAETFMRERSKEVVRLWYLKAATIATAIALVLSLIAFLISLAVTQVQVENMLLELSIGGFGALGAFVSGVLRLSAVSAHDARAGKALHYAEAAARIVAGVIAGMLAVAAIKSGVLLGGDVFKVDDATGDGLDQSRYVVFLVCILAGASERLIPNLVGRFDGGDANKG